MPSPAGIVYPYALPQPIMDGLSFTREDNRSAFQPEVGVPRRRNTMRTKPSIFNVQFVYTQAQYAAFDDWWHIATQGGALEFDIQITAPFIYLMWYTCEAIDEPDAEYLDGGRWRVSMKLRSKYESFNYRWPGTDELYGLNSVGIGAAKGKMLIAVALHGATSVGIGDATGRMILEPLRGAATSVGIGTARGRVRWVDLRGRVTTSVGIGDAKGKLEVL